MSWLLKSQLRSAMHFDIKNLNNMTKIRHNVLQSQKKTLIGFFLREIIKERIEPISI